MTEPLPALSRRERQFMDILLRAGRATAEDVRAALPDPPSYSAVRAVLRILETKGHARHAHDGPRYVFTPTRSREAMKRSALRHLVRTFFEGSAEKVMATLLDPRDGQLSPGSLNRMSELIALARKDAECS